LRRAEPEENVISIASRWGFLHMGRFAAVYRKRFGEAPSETLGKRFAAPGLSLRMTPVRL
jgi:AraC-like DNA-binding protein